MRRCRQTMVPLLLALATLCYPAASSADARVGKTLIVTSSEEGVYAEIIAGVRLADPGRFNVIALDANGELAPLVEPPADILTIGTRAAEAVYRLAPGVPVLSALITESGFNYLATMYFESVDGALAQGVSAIYLDQPLARLYQLGALLLPEARDVGVLTGDVDNAVRDFAPDADKGVALSYVTVASDSRPINELSPIIQRSDFVIALPGKRATTVSAAKWILKISSQTRTPVIAYSKKYARSGALAAVYSAPTDVVEDILSVVSRRDAGPEQTARVYIPRAFSVELNRTVAGILRVPVKEAAEYRELLMRMEGKE